MKIIGGTFRGRNLKTPKDAGIRPTTGRLRESLFSSLEHRIGGFSGKRVADIFSGTGALGLEALSRGADFVTWVEKHGPGISLLEENIRNLGVADRGEVLRADARTLPRAGTPFDVVFMDPPYGMGLAEPTLKSLMAGKWLTKTTVVALEMDKKEDFSPPTGLEIFKDLTQGYRRVQFIRLK